MRTSEFDRKRKDGVFQKVMEALDKAEGRYIMANARGYIAFCVAGVLNEL